MLGSPFVFGTLVLPYMALLSFDGINTDVALFSSFSTHAPQIILLLQLFHLLHMKDTMVTPNVDRIPLFPPVLPLNITIETKVSR